MVSYHTNGSASIDSLDSSMILSVPLPTWKKTTLETLAAGSIPSDPDQVHSLLLQARDINEANGRNHAPSELLPYAQLLYDLCTTTIDAALADASHRGMRTLDLAHLESDAGEYAFLRCSHERDSEWLLRGREYKHRAANRFANEEQFYVAAACLQRSATFASRGHRLCSKKTRTRAHERAWLERQFDDNVESSVLFSQAGDYKDAPERQLLMTEHAATAAELLAKSYGNSPKYTHWQANAYHQHLSRAKLLAQCRPSAAISAYQTVATLSHDLYHATGEPAWALASATALEVKGNLLVAEGYSASSQSSYHAAEKFANKAARTLDHSDPFHAELKEVASRCHNRLDELRKNAKARNRKREKYYRDEGRYARLKRTDIKNRSR